MDHCEIQIIVETINCKIVEEFQSQTQTTNESYGYHFSIIYTYK